MSDRPHGSVRTGNPASGEPDTGQAVPVTDTQSIPTTGTQSIPTTGTQSIPTTGSQSAPATGTQSIPTTGSQSAPVTGTQSIPTTGSHSAPATGSQSAPVTGSQSAPATGTQSVPTTGSQRAAGPPAGGGAPVRRPAAPATGPTGVPTGAGAAVAGGGGGKGRPGRSSGRGPRRARLQLRHIDTWSALKISLVLSIALFCIWMVAVGVLYGVLNSLGVFETLNELFGQLGADSGTAEGEDVLRPGVVFGGAAVIGAINIVLLTALCTVGTFIYNMCSDLVGGLELTLSERD